MRWSLLALGLAAVAALAASTGACGSIISVPDQGIIVTGCQQPASCFVRDCSCNRNDAIVGDMAGLGDGQRLGCVTAPHCDVVGDPSTCNCPSTDDPDGGIQNPPLSQCLEPSMACVGRGVFCAKGGLCYPGDPAHPGVANCGASDPRAQPPMLIPTVGMPMLEPHCQFVDDVCCPGTAPVDGGATD